MNRSGLDRFVACWLLGILALSGPAAAEQADPQPPAAAGQAGSASLVGKIVEANGKTPVAGAVVRACYLEGDASFTSDPTGANGEYEILELPPGYADVMVETRDGTYLVNQVLSLLPRVRFVAEFVLRKSDGATAPAAPGGALKESACGALSFLGTAEIAQKSSAKQFLRSPAGIAIIAGGAGLLLLLATSGGDETPASPFLPP